MSATSFVRAYIFRVAREKVFTTRELLSFGPRAAVDQALCRLVKRGLIRRLARGVFVKDIAGLTFSALEVATVKARSFGRRIIAHGATIGEQFNLNPKASNETTYAIDGRSSSFKYGDTTVHFKGISPRQMQCGDTRAGSAVQALWSLGSSYARTAPCPLQQFRLGRTEIQELRHLVRFMPQWITDWFILPQRWDTETTRAAHNM